LLPVGFLLLGELPTYLGRKVGLSVVKKYFELQSEITIDIINIPWWQRAVTLIVALFIVDEFIATFITNALIPRPIFLNHIYIAWKEQRLELMYTYVIAHGVITMVTFFAAGFVMILYKAWYRLRTLKHRN